jgi:hypothetical protein
MEKKLIDCQKIFILDKEIANIILDPHLETADTDRNNNYWPSRIEPTRFQLFKQKERKKENTMQRAKKAEDKIKNDK